jgi:predicted O-methyltransferase YrrM
MHSYITNCLQTASVSLPDGTIKPLTANIDLEEAEFLLSTVSKLGKIDLGVEVGLACGISAGIICSTASLTNPDYQHIAVDPYQGIDYSYSGIETVKSCGYNNIRLIEERSDTALPALIHKYEGKVDLAFIDGLHTFDATLCDMMMCLRLLRVGGVMIIDDCRMPPVAKAVSYFQNYKCIQTLAGSPNNSRQLSRFLSLAAARIPRKIAAFLPCNIYNFLYPRSRMSTMMAIQKVSPDERHWNWYQDF